MGSRALRGTTASQARTEALRSLRASLLVAVGDRPNPIVAVTSARRGEGRTTTCVGLAETLAAARRRVVLVDLDLRHPDLARRFGLGVSMGVVDVLAGRCTLDQARQPTPGGFEVVTAGTPTDRPTELLGDPALAELLGRIAAQADLVVVDTTPVLAVADTLVVARSATGAVLVVEAGRTSTADVLAAKTALTRAEIPIFGVTLNKIDAGEFPCERGLGFGWPGRHRADHSA